MFNASMDQFPNNISNESEINEIFVEDNQAVYDQMMQTDQGQPGRDSIMKKTQLVLQEENEELQRRLTPNERVRQKNPDMLIHTNVQISPVEKAAPLLGAENNLSKN